MRHECILCGVEDAWIDDGGPPDGWIFVERFADPICGACLGSLGFGPRGPAIVRSMARLRQTATVLFVEYFDVPPEDEAVYRWLGCEPTVDVAGEPCWRWNRPDDEFQALEPVRLALQEASSRQVFP
jgi:hypothetical protein